MRKSTSFFVLFIFLFISAGLQAAIEKDLGQALAFFRVTDAQADQFALVDAITHRSALVIDLRGTTCEPDFVEALHAALAKTPPPHAVRVVLINAATTKSVIAALDDDALLAVVTLAPRTPNVDADILVATTPEAERLALAALSDGIPLEKLIGDTRDKRRYDEAKLVHDHANGVSPADEELPADAEDDTISVEPSKKKATNAEKKVEQPPHDPVLERAVQLHRALLALKKL